MTNSLKKIINDKKIVIEKYKKTLTLEHLEKKISLYKDYLDFKAKPSTRECGWCDYRNICTEAI